MTGDRDGDDVRSPRVLIVDDDEDIRGNMSDILQELGYRTTSAADGATALDLMREGEFEVAVLDLKMPGMSGLELCQAIRDRHPRTAAVLVTAHAGDGVAEEAVRRGVRRVFQKPVDLPELIDCLAHASAG